MLSAFCIWDDCRSFDSRVRLETNWLSVLEKEYLRQMNVICQFLCVVGTSFKGVLFCIGGCFTMRWKKSFRMQESRRL